MTYSDDDIKELYRKIATIVKYDNKGTASLKDLQKEPKWKEINFQEKCEGDNSLGDLLLKHATENNNPRVKDFLLQNGCRSLQQEQITAAINKEEKEQNIPNVEENGAESNIGNGNVDNKPAPSKSTEKTDVSSTAMPNEETKYKESKKNFYASLRNDIIGVFITGLFIAAAVMVPPVAGAVACGILAALVAIVTGLHVKNSTLPSYREMRENKVTEFQRHVLG